MNIPKTQAALEQWMKEHCYNFDSYSINGNMIYEGLGIDNSQGLYRWYYTERGEISILKHFLTEEEIIEYAYHQLISDKWARTHCIGFTVDKHKSLELAEELQLRGIEYLQDEIPYYEPGKPAFRTFVFGCDHKLTDDLKEKYFESH